MELCQGRKINLSTKTWTKESSFPNFPCHQTAYTESLRFPNRGEATDP